MPEPTKVDVLRGALGAKNTYSDRELARLARLFRIARFAPGEVLMHENDAGDDAHLVADGQVEVTKGGLGVAVVGKGKFVGELALRDGGRRTATVTAKTEVRTLHVDAAQFTKLIADPGIQKQIDREIARRRSKEEAAAGPSTAARGAGNGGTGAAAPAGHAPSGLASEDDELAPLNRALAAVRARRKRRQRRSMIGTVAAVVVLLLVAGVVIRTLAFRTTPIALDTAVARFHEAQKAADDSSGGGEQTEAAASGDQPGEGSAAGRAASAAAGGTVPAAGQAAAGARASTTAEGPAAASAVEAGTGVPEAGVYVYKTRGTESVSILGGSRHTYPDETTITVTRTPCGANIRWDALEERWDEWSTCRQDGATMLASLITYHEFFEQGDAKHFICDPGTALVPARLDPGTTFGGRCTNEEGASDLSGRVVGKETVQVGGRSVEAIRVRIDQKLTGHTRGTRFMDSWYAPESGLLLKRHAGTQADAKATFGRTDYNEELTLELTNLSPKR